MRINEVVLGGVPSTWLSTRDGAPLVMFSNGFSAPRSQGVPPGVPENPISPPIVTGLLDAGYGVILPENPGHGERLAPGDTSIDALRRGFLGDDTDLVQLTVDETRGIVDDAVAQGIVRSPDSIAALGHSWGAFQSILRMTGDSRIAGGVALIPVIDPRCLDPFATLPPALNLDNYTLTDRAKASLGSRPLLLISSTDDDVAPASYVRDFVAHVRGSNPNNALSCLELDDVGHHYDPRQLDATLVWLHEHLPVIDKPEALSRTASTRPEEARA
jgi:pimeloyl-ACP methyl ester carboxylesterase